MIRKLRAIDPAFLGCGLYRFLAVTRSKNEMSIRNHSRCSENFVCFGAVRIFSEITLHRAIFEIALFLQANVAYPSKVLWSPLIVSPAL